MIANLAGERAPQQATNSDSNANSNKFILTMMNDEIIFILFLFSIPSEMFLVYKLTTFVTCSKCVFLWFHCL